MGFNKQSKQTCAAVQGDRGVTINDFWAHGPSRTFIFMPCREVWTALSVDHTLGRQPLLNSHGNPVYKSGKAVTVPASVWLMQNRRVEQMTWVPGAPSIIRDKLLVGGSWIHRPEVSGLNMYRPPMLEHGDPTKAERWIELVHFVFPDDAEHIMNWLAQRVQDPANKINHALVLGSEDQGIGKDMILKPLREAVGPWNFEEISPEQLLGSFTGFAKSVVLRINESHDTGPVDRFKFYDRMKIYAASPPEVLRVNEKHMREYYALNCVGVIITTNNRTDGLFLSASDRRHYVAWSDRKRSERTCEFWNSLMHWYVKEGGYGHVAAYLAQRDLSKFDPKVPPPQTAAFAEIVAVGNTPEDGGLIEAIDRLGAKIYPGELEPDTDEQRKPDVFTLRDLIAVAPELEWLLDHKHRPSAPHKLGRCGYFIYPNPKSARKTWKVHGTWQSIYVKGGLGKEDKANAVEVYQERCRREQE